MRETAAPHAQAPTPATAAANPTTPATLANPVSTGVYGNLFQQAAALQTNDAAPTATDPLTATDLSFLRDNPQFQNLRQMVQAQPNILPHLLQQIGATQPQLLQV
jgi:UV excision repair protein RAD23